jgi:hypothetical protein
MRLGLKTFLTDASNFFDERILKEKMYKILYS